jgi:hypothetical protein
MVMSFTIYEKDYKHEFDLLDLEHMKIDHFLISVEMRIGTELGEVLKEHPGAAAHMQEAAQKAVHKALDHPLHPLMNSLTEQEHFIDKAKTDGDAQQLTNEMF